MNRTFCRIVSAAILSSIGTGGINRFDQLVAAEHPALEQGTDYRVVLKLKRHVVDWNEPVTLEATVRTTKDFVVVSVEYHTQRMAFFHRGMGRVVFIDNEPINRIPTEQFDQLGPTVGGPLLTPSGPWTYAGAVTTRAKSPGMFIIRMKWDVREKKDDGSLSEGTIELTSNWVLIDVRATEEWRSRTPCPKGIDSTDPLDDQEVLERLYTGHGE